MNKATLNENLIREAAYGLWLEEGQPHGRDEAHWLRAVELLKASPQTSKPARKATATSRVSQRKAAPKKSVMSRAKTPKKKD